MRGESSSGAGRAFSPPCDGSSPVPGRWNISRLVTSYTYWIDALFGIFTERQQRAFEVLSKTRVVLADPPREARRAQ